MAPGRAIKGAAAEEKEGLSNNSSEPGMNGEQDYEEYLSYM